MDGFHLDLDHRDRSIGAAKHRFQVFHLRAQLRVLGAVFGQRSQILRNLLHQSLGAINIEFALVHSRHYIRVRIRGSLREAAADSSLGTPTMIGAIADISAGIPSSSLISGVLRPETAEPMTQVPRPMEKAASIRFSAASQQSATTNGPIGLPQMTISVPAL